ncbi:MAG: sulfatase [Planctomycetes bacterium]|nr:sulfatase [Planctomycetota bacterium]
MAKPPNILFVFGDQHRGQDLRCMGNSDVITPNFDRLAEGGSLFTNAISNCPLCVPARGSLITGRHPLSHKAVSNDLPLSTDEVGIAELLKPLGYRTGYIGKWHLDGVPRDKFTPPGKRRFGFDYWAAWECHHNYFKGRYHRDTPEVHHIEGYEPDFQTDLAIRFMEENRGDPFCLFLSWGPPHAPYQLVPDKYKAMYDPSKIALRPNAKDPDRQVLADYYAAITALDWNMGRMMEALDRLGIAEDTLVVYSSDHGDMLWSQGTTKKEQPWEESVLIPFIIRWPGRIPAGRRADTLLSIVDMPPTLLGLAGADVPERMEGADLSKGVVGDKMEEPQSVFLYLPMPAGQANAKGIGPWRGVRTKRHTYARWRDGSGWVLYDNEKDPYQLNNLIDDPASQDLRSRLESDLQYWLGRTGDKFLAGEDHLRELGLGELWNESEKILGGKRPRWIR